MKKLPAIALLVIMAAALSACRLFENGGTTVVRSVAAVALQQFLKIQRCATLTQTSVNESGAKPPVARPAAPQRPAQPCSAAVEREARMACPHAKRQRA